jgi:VCBS repeat-containing protein
LYFGITADGLLRSGHITNDQETGEASQTAAVDMIFGSGVSADEVQALAVDPLNHIIFVGLWGQSDSTTSILEVQYDPVTGALTSPYNASTAAITDFNHVLLHDDNTGKVGGVNFTNPIAMQYDMQNGNLYYVDQTNGTSFNGGSGATWQATNGIYVVSTTGTVGGGTAPTPTLLSLNSQFAAGDNNNYIEGLALNEAQNIIYFCVNNASNSTSKLYYMPITGGTATQITLPSSFFADNNLAGVNPISFDPNLRQLYISDNAHSKIIQVTLDAAGHVASSTNMSFMDFDSGVGGSSATGLYFDPLPTLSTLSATTTEAVQGGSAITLLTAAPSITDPQDGAVNKLHMGYLQVVVADAQAGDNLYYSGAQSGTFDSGKMTISWNSSTHTLTITGNETEAFYDTLFQNISFQDSGTDNSVGSHPTRTIDWVISDGTTVVNQTTADPNEKATTVVIDRAPTLTADNYAVLETATVTGTSGTAGTGVLGNDTDKDADAIVVTAVNGNAANVGLQIAGTYGHLTLNANGSYSYVADSTSNIDNAATGSHPVDTFTYTVSDGLGGVTASAVSFTIDRAPTVVADAPANQAVESGAPVTGNVLTNDSDKDGDTLTVSAVNGVGGNVGNSIAGTYGHITIGSDGAYTYSADITSAIDSAATGSHLTDTFTYTANDGHGGTTTTTITVVLDRAPTITNDNFGTQVVEGASTGLVNAASGVLANDSDRDGDSLFVSAVGGSAANVGNPFATTYGHITLNADGSYTYTADNTIAIDAAPLGSHPIDTVTVTASDGHGGTTTETLSFTIDRPAIATTDSISTAENADAVNGSGGNPNLLANDTDKDGDAITITAVNGAGANVGNQIVLASGALLTVNADGTYTYDPNHAFDYLAAAGSGASDTTATDTFTYTIDGGATVTVTITINGVDSNDSLVGTSGDDTMHGGIGDDTVTALNGNDTLFGDSGNDAFVMGANLTAADKIDGGTNTDHVILDGDYSGVNAVVFAATTMVNVEFLTLTAGHSYSLTMDNATVGAGQTLQLQAGSLGVGDNVTFDASADTTGGMYNITTGAGDDVLTGGANSDKFSPGSGNDTIHAGDGKDAIFMLGNLTAADQIDGGDGHDVMSLLGDYSAGVTFGATTMTNIELLRIGAGFDYNLTLDALNVTSGEILTVRAETLAADDDLIFDASAIAGRLVITSGAGNDTLSGGSADDLIKTDAGDDVLTGNGGSDTMLGGVGHDTFVYNQASDSSSVTYDKIKDFDGSLDTFQLNGYSVNALDLTVASGKLSTVDFDNDLATAIGLAQLGAHDAVLFDPTRGNLNGHTFLIVDLNGVAGYQAGQDLVIDITGASNLNDLSVGNFTH